MPKKKVVADGAAKTAKVKKNSGSVSVVSEDPIPEVQTDVTSEAKVESPCLKILPWAGEGDILSSLSEHRVLNRFGSFIPVTECELGRWVDYQVQVKTEDGSETEGVIVSGVLLTYMKDDTGLKFQVALVHPKNGKLVGVEVINPMQVRKVGKKARFV